MTQFFFRFAMLLSVVSAIKAAVEHHGEWSLAFIAMAVLMDLFAEREGVR